MLRLGTRGSKLALTQSNMVRTLIVERGNPCELTVVKTSGDRIQDRPLADVGGKGLFTKELEQALLAHEVDLAVHSMKDVPVLLPDGLMLAAILPREDTRDAFISKIAKTLDELPKGARVGTASVRRTAQLARLRPDHGTMDDAVIGVAGGLRFGRDDGDLAANQRVEEGRLADIGAADKHGEARLEIGRDFHRGHCTREPTE